LGITRRELAEIMHEAGEEWLPKKLRLSPHEWDYLGWLAKLWFKRKLQKKWALARLFDEIRIAFAPPPTTACSLREISIRKSDWEFVLGLKKLMGYDSATGVIRGFLYMMDTAPEAMFPDPRHYWEEPKEPSELDRHTTHWARKVLKYIKKRRGETLAVRKKLDEVWHTCRHANARKRLSCLRMRQLQTCQRIDWEEVGNA